MIRGKLEQISGFGNYPSAACWLYRPDTLREVKELLSAPETTRLIARGLGRSYGDQALNPGQAVVLQTGLNRFLSFDAVSGIVECEAGATLAELIEVFLPRGFFLPVTPGTKFITIGGAIANDVHGKNHHQDGCLSSHLLDFQLLTATGELVACSREQNADLFWATIGGMGLTGILVSARIKLLPVESAYMDVEYQKAPNIEAALDLFDATDRRYQYSVAWIDCLAAGASLGRSVLMRGNHAPADRLPKSCEHPLKPPVKRKASVPFYCPDFLLNRYSVNLFNSVYYRSYQNRRKMVDYDSFFYPLDSIYNWNRIYGKRGFIQYQAVFPPATGKQALVEMLETVSGSKRSSFLAVLKSFGKANQGLLSFPMKGYTLALDMPFSGPDMPPFLRNLDELVVRHGGRVYLAKDSCLAPDLFPVMYPGLARFQEIKRKVDPAGLFATAMARRLGIVEDFA